MDILESMKNKPIQSNWSLENIPSFISFEDCDELIELIKDDYQPSTVGLGGETTLDDSRKSFTTPLCDCEGVVKRLRDKTAKHLGVNKNQIEGIQGQYYQKGGYFKEHTDGFDSQNIKKYGLASGQRIKTLMVYLNFDLEGGETYFPNVDRGFMPMKGWAVTWDNVREDGTIEPASKHEAKEVKFGEKYVVTLWIRENKWQPSEDDRLHQEWVVEQNGLPKLYGEKAFDRLDTPQEVTNILTTIMMAEKDKGETETKLNEIKGKTKLYNLDKYKQQTQQIHKILQPIAEKMSGEILEPTFIYGLREYTNGASLKMHRDRQDTHVVSFSITYFKDANWPICIEGIDNGEYNVELEPGQMLYYQGAKFKHGRPKPYEGKSYINLYVHYKIKDNPIDKVPQPKKQGPITI